MGGRNNVYLVNPLTGEPGHFRLREFENRDGIAVVHRVTLESLELVRQTLCALVGETVWVVITDAVRTQADLDRLAGALGWTNQGGAVSRDSKHLLKYGGIAVDLMAVVASTKERVPQHELGEVCRRHFDWVKDDYADGHVHADNRDRAGQQLELAEATA